MKIFITGATGFLGNYLVTELSPQFETLFILTRNPDSSGLKFLPNVVLIKGDITNLSIIDNEEERNIVINEADIVLHAAAHYQMTATHSECYMQNVVGTQNTLRLVKKMKKLKVFYYISTIAVGDDESFFLEEDIFPMRSKFNDYYSETKYHAERLVRETFLSDVLMPPVRIIRPGIIVGDSQTGEMPKIDGPYYFIEAVKKYAHLLKSLPVLPLSFNPRTKIPLIPVDHCARFIALLIKRDKLERRILTYHLISHEVPSVKEFLEDLNAHFKIKTSYFPVYRNALHNALLKFFGIPKAVVPFMFSKLSYDKTRTLDELPELKSSLYSAYKNKLFGKI